MNSIKVVLMTRDGMSERQAEEAIAGCKAELLERIEDGEMPFDICAEHFGLEPDYLMELIEM